MNGWLVGYLVGGVVVLIVVAVLLLMIRGATHLAERVEAVLSALHDTRDGTAALWAVQTTVVTAERIVAAAAAARTGLGGMTP